MVFTKLKVGINLIYSIFVSIGVFIWALVYILFVFIIPFKWKIWRTSSKFNRFLVINGIPRDTAIQITGSYYKQLSFISIWKWWRALERERKNEHRGKTKTSNKTT